MKNGRQQNGNFVRIADLHVHNAKTGFGPTVAVGSGLCDIQRIPAK